jgi:nicotinamide-nucleotide amidase
MPQPLDGITPASNSPTALELRSLAHAVLERAEKCHALVATAESCTGGMVATILTALPGASEVVLGGIVSYANEVKEHVLGVDPMTLETVGAVSEECVREMAAGCCDRMGATVSVAISGIAGPGGGTAQKPVGTVWFATATATGEGESAQTQLVSVCKHFDGGRHEVRIAAAREALELLVLALDQVGQAR